MPERRTMPLRIGSLFSGYGGLDLAVQQVYEAEPVWHVEFDDAPSRILAQHWPDVPNLHDVTAVDWEQVEPIDILTGGFPCQDVSVAGRRAGMTDGTRSGLWSHMAHAIDVLRPQLVVIENVGGLFSAKATSTVEPHPLCLGNGGTGSDTVLLRAIDAVLSTLSELGYDAEWTALRASDVGAPHGRLRVFITAHPAPDTGGGGSGGRASLTLAGVSGGADAPTLGADGRPDAPGRTPGLTLLPTPASQPSGNSPEEHLRKKPGRKVVTDLSIIAENGLFGTGGRLLPTPMTSYSSRDVETWRAQRPAGNGNVREAVGDLAIVAEQILPTPRATDGTKGGPSRAGSSGDLMPTSAVQSERFGPYAPAIQRWEQVLGRPAPDPTEPGKNRPRLAAKFVEFLMGLPDGHVTGVGLTRNQELKALGNGVVPQQGAAALAHLHSIRSTNP